MAGQEGPAAAPIFIVGQPRSGSTLLTRILNEDTGLFIVNDFYVLQKIDAHNLWGDLDERGAARIAGWVFDRIHIRATEEVGKTLSQSIDLSAEALDALREFVARPFPAGTRWHDVLAGVMGKAAELAGCIRWGYNTPQDHLHLARLFPAFPEAKVLFLLRQPEAVLRSYKNVSGPWHDPKRYNPLAIGLAWKAASRSYEAWSAAKPGQVALLRYEEMTDDTRNVLRGVEAFLDIRIPEMDLASLGRNSSFVGRESPKALTSTEAWLCGKVIGSHAARRGFRPVVGRPRFRDAVALGRIGAATVQFLLKEVLFDADRRKRVMKLFRFQSAAG